MKSIISGIIFTLISFSLFAQPTSWENKGICGGGATFYPSVSPHDDSQYFITSDMGGIFKTENAGEEFNLLPFYEITSKAAHSKVFYTANPNVLYSFSYTTFPSPYEPVKSIDGGETWQLLGNDPTSGQTFQVFVDPHRDDRLLITDYKTAYLSNDGGASFTAVIHGVETIYVGGVFWDNTSVYVGTNQGLYTSHNNGQTFTPEGVNGEFPSNQGIRSMAGKKVGNQVTLYAISKAPLWGGYEPSNYWAPQSKVLRLDYGAGNTWEDIENGFTIGESTFHPNLIVTNENSPNTIYLGGFDMPGMEVYKSTDAGDNWNVVFDAENDNMNLNIETGWLGAGSDFNWWWSGPVVGMEVAINNADIVIITDFMSSHHSRDGGASWESLYTKTNELNPANQNTPQHLNYTSNGLEVTSSWWLTWMTEDDIFASYTDIQGFISHDNGDSWSTDYDYPQSYNTTYKTVKHPSNGKIYAVVCDKHDIYESVYLTDALLDDGTGEVYESSDNGLTWTSTYDFNRTTVDLAIDPNNDNRFYASIINSNDGGIYYSNNYGSTWTHLPNPPRTEGHPVEVEILNDGTLVAVFSARNSNNVFSASSGVFVSQDNGQTWQDRSANEMLYWTRDLEISPSNDDVWYASVFSHWGPNNNGQGGLYRTLNRGLSWENIADLYRVRSMTVHPSNPDVAYVCTADDNNGLQFTDNLTSASPNFIRLDDYHFHNPQRVFFNPYDEDEVWVTSFGNGIKKGLSEEDIPDNNDDTSSPFEIPTTWENKGICGGGATFYPSVSPHDDRQYFITSDMGGIFKTENAGEEFDLLPFYEITSKAAHSKVFYTSNPDMLYSFSYTTFPSPYEPVKSKDGGETWQLLGNDPTSGQVFQVFVDPHRDDRLIITDYRTAYLSSDGGASFNAVIHGVETIYIGGVFWDDTSVYVGTNQGLYTSHNNGQTFTSEGVNGDFPSTHGIRSMAGKKVGNQVTLYAISKTPLWGGYEPSNYWSPNSKVLRLDYGAGTWEDIESGFMAASSGGNFHPNLILTNEDKPNTIYLGGYDAPGMEVYKSTDAGDNWDIIFDAENDNMNLNIETGWLGAGSDFNWWWSGPVVGMEVAINNADIVIITDFMSSHHTRNGGASWQSLYTKASERNPANQNTPQHLNYSSNGLEVTSSWWLTWMTEDDMFASYTDIQGFISHDKGDSWSTDYDYPQNYNTTYKTVKHPSNGKIYSVVCDKHDIYESVYLTDALLDDGTGEIYESSDNGLTWTSTYDFNRTIVDLAIDPNNDNRFYASIINSNDGGIYYSNNYGSTWTHLPNPPRTEGHPVEVEILNDGTLLAVFSARNSNNVFSASSGVFMSQNNGQTWVDRSANEMLYWTRDLEVSPSNDDVWYASVFSHWGPNNNEQGGLYRTLNRGLTWENVADLYRVRSMTIHPSNPDIAYVCTADDNNGLQFTQNLTAASPTFARVEDYHFHNPQRVFFNPFNENEVWVTSFGNGIKKGVNNGDCPDSFFLSDNLASITYQVSDEILSDGLIQANKHVIFKAGEINLLDNFEVEEIATFHALINPCN